MIYHHALTAIITAALASTGAWKVQNWRFAAIEQQRASQVAEVRETQARGADKAAEAHEVEKVKIRTEVQQIFTEVERVVEKPVYRNVCFDDDGLRQLQRAIGSGAGTGQPAPALPGLDRAD